MEILSLIDKLEGLVTSSARVPATRKVLIDADRVLDMVDQLRLAVPKDVQEAQEVLAKREGVINQALLEARRIKNSADEESRSRVDQSEIMRGANSKADEVLSETKKRADAMIQDAQRKAHNIMQEAQGFSDTRYNEANHYAQETLYKLEQELSNLLNGVRRGLDLLGAEQPAAKAG
ncbi:MAG: hypothetical protein HY686_02820 [Chloroflexi bacterium]|nr:hypothetical protein [Chloroflexota bacterium]